MRLQRFITGLFSLSLLLVGIYGCSAWRGKSVGEQLLEASKAAGVEVHGEDVFSISRGTETFAAAPIVGWDSVPATELRNGVNIAFAYFATSEPNVPKGYYTVKAFADVADVGTTTARVQLIDRQGRVAAEIPGEAEIHSMTVPARPAFARSHVTTAALRENPGSTYYIWYRCTNGQCVRHPIFVPA